MTRTAAVTRRALLVRQRYDHYITSPTWTKRRRQWLWAERKAHNGIVRCAVCRCVWGTPRAGGELHHLTYDRLGAERHDDLVALCTRCHRDVERIYGFGRFRGVQHQAGMRAVVTALARERQARRTA